LAPILTGRSVRLRRRGTGGGRRASLRRLPLLGRGTGGGSNGTARHPPCPLDPGPTPVHPHALEQRALTHPAHHLAVRGATQVLSLVGRDDQIEEIGRAHV